MTISKELKLEVLKEYGEKSGILHLRRRELGSRMARRLFGFAVLFFLAASAVAQDDSFWWLNQQIKGPECLTIKWVYDGGSKPCTQNDYRIWMETQQRWRSERLIRVGYDGWRYGLPELKWTQRNFIQPQMMVHDRYFYDPAKGEYTVDRYLDDLEKRYGGIDSVLIWPTYPNMGIDDRNQLDMVRSMPGGAEGVKRMVADFHRRGVHVLFPMMMWDQGTHDPGKPWPVAIAELMKFVGADGVNGDTQDGVPLSFSLAAEAVGHPLAFEPEVGPADEGLAWNLMTWGQYRFPLVPMIDKFKWLESRHMVNISDRWKREKTDDLQFAFFNGVGWVSWENIWGIWNGITPRDGEATRRVAAIERGLAPFLVSPEWQPFFPMEQSGAFSSRWPLGDQSAWTIVNRNDYTLKGVQMRLASSEGMHFYDLYRGIEILPERRGTETLLSFDLEAYGYGAILSTPTPLQGDLAALLLRMHAMTSKPLADYPHEWSFLPQSQITIRRTRMLSVEPQKMIKIPATEFNFRVEGVEIEGENRGWVDVQYPWEDSPRRFHLHTIHIASFWIDRFPVTNAEFKKFLDAKHYRPADNLNFLKDWKDGTFPEGWANRPVTWVSIEDAREYAHWAGKRLPHEWEWQYAAQGDDGRAFPWGSCDWTIPPGIPGAFACPVPATEGEAVAPAPDKGRTMQAASDVDAHPKGASPFGVMDMVGNVWQWTDEYVDEHTRAAILRGGSHYQPQASFWYFPQAYRLDQHGKLLLMAPSMDRSGAVGFRCVVDTE